MWRLGGLAVAAVLAVASAAALPDLDKPPYIQAHHKAVLKAFGPDIARKIFSNDFTPLRHDAVVRSAKTIPGFDCPTEVQMTLTDVVPYPVKPGAISWIEAYWLACAPKARRSFLLLLDGEKIRVAELLPGYTVTDPLLQRDAIVGARSTAVALKPAGCDKSIITDTRITGDRTGPDTPWIERWSFDLCGTKVDVEMTFAPSGKGGTTWSSRLLLQ